MNLSNAKADFICSTVFLILFIFLSFQMLCYLSELHLFLDLKWIFVSCSTTEIKEVRQNCKIFKDRGRAQRQTTSAEGFLLSFRANK